MRILSHNLSSSVVLLALAESAAGAVSFYGGAALRFQGDVGAAAETIGMLAPRAALFVVLGLLGLLATGLYRTHQRVTFNDILLRLITALSLAGAANAIIYYLVPQLATGRGALALALVVFAILICVVRISFLAVVDNEYLKRRVLVIGAGRRARTIAMLRRKSDQRNFRVVSYLRRVGDAEVSDIVSRSLETDEIPAFVLENSIDEIVIAMDECRSDFPTQALLDCRLRGVRITDLISFLERETGRVNLDVLRPGWLIYSQGFRRGIYHSTMKRFCDLGASLLLLALVCPLLLLTGLAIWLESGGRGPIFYRQHRVGFEGKQFGVFKFRSMIVGAEENGGAQWARENDERITLVGKIIRRFRIDEIPQLINVLRGEMSFVGPRPERPEFVERLAEKIPFYRERHCVKPGLAGWAQLCYPYGASVEDAWHKLQYDLYYVKNHGVAFDMLIILQTLEVVLWGRSPGMSRRRRATAAPVLAERTTE